AFTFAALALASFAFADGDAGVVDDDARGLEAGVALGTIGARLAREREAVVALASAARGEARRDRDARADDRGASEGHAAERSSAGVELRDGKGRIRKASDEALVFEPQEQRVAGARRRVRRERVA